MSFRGVFNNDRMRTCGLYLKQAGRIQVVNQIWAHACHVDQSGTSHLGTYNRPCVKSTFTHMRECELGMAVGGKAARIWASMGIGTDRHSPGKGLSRISMPCINHNSQTLPTQSMTSWQRLLFAQAHWYMKPINHDFCTMH